jgi:cobyrinic acid a,c-diamide synthase
VAEKFAFLVGGTHSGCGKTTISLALMAAFKARGLQVQPFKVGPDFIDPGFHTQITGLSSRNLDGWMLGKEYSGTLFRRLLDSADMAIVEGVMGLFDGYDGITESGSSAEMAKWLGLPVVLVVDARSMARSAAALVYGFRYFDPGLNFAGIIFNQIGGEGHLEYLKEAMSASLPDIAVLGGIPREDPIRIPERHLGLVTADEISIEPVWEQRLADLVERYVDLDAILKQASVDVETDGRNPVAPVSAVESAVTIAVARDTAFCFYYRDNFELLCRAGAELRFFAPVAGESLPEYAAGLYLGGGYPELCAENLSSQNHFLDAIRSVVLRGMPVYAECGGLMVLSRFIETLDGKRHSMAGVLPFGTRMLPRRKALGYTEVVLQDRCLLGERDQIIRGHEFHYSEIVEAEADPAMTHVYKIRGRKYGNDRPEGYTVGSALASYVHLHWGSAPEAAASFVRRCREYRAGAE